MPSERLPGYTPAESSSFSNAPELMESSEAKH